jgi:YtcA-like protein
LIAGWSKYSPGRIGAKLPLAALTLAAPFCAGCDPVVDIAGADFPAWLICAIAGVALAAVLRTLLVAIRIEPHLGPLTVVYPCLAVLLSCVVWMIFFNRI